MDRRLEMKSKKGREASGVRQLTDTEGGSRTSRCCCPRLHSPTIYRQFIALQAVDNSSVLHVTILDNADSMSERVR